MNNPIIATDLLCEKIAGGVFDADLHTINKALQQRAELLRKVKAETLRFSVKPGDRVVLDGLKPKYVNGLTAIVKEINRTRAVITPEQPTRRFRGDVTVPLTCITPVEKEVLA